MIFNSFRCHSAKKVFGYHTKLQDIQRPVLLTQCWVAIFKFHTRIPSVVLTYFSKRKGVLTRSNIRKKFFHMYKTLYSVLHSDVLGLGQLGQRQVEQGFSSSFAKFLMTISKFHKIWGKGRKSFFNLCSTHYSRQLPKPETWLLKPQSITTTSDEVGYPKTRNPGGGK